VCVCVCVCVCVWRHDVLLSFVILFVSVKLVDITLKVLESSACSVSVLCCH